MKASGFLNKALDKNLKQLEALDNYNKTVREAGLTGQGEEYNSEDDEDMMQMGSDFEGDEGEGEDIDKEGNEEVKEDDENKNEEKKEEEDDDDEDDEDDEESSEEESDKEKEKEKKMEGLPHGFSFRVQQL